MSDVVQFGWLAIRTGVRRGEGARATGIVLALGTMVLTALALIAVAVPQVAGHQRQRLYATTPHVLPDGQRQADDTSVLRVLDSQLVPVRRWNEHTIARSYYVRGTSTTLAPGVPEMPDADEYYASPALAELIERDPVVAALFERRRSLGTIGDAGLVQPHELRAIAGISAQANGLRAVDRFGSDPAPGLRQGADMLDNVVMVLGALLAGLPAAAFVVIVTRLSGRQRQHRARALRLLGVSTAGVRALHFGETVLVSLPTALVTAGVIWWAAGHVTRIPGTDIGFFASDSRIDVALHLAAVIGVTLILASAAAFAVRLGGGVDAVVVTRAARRPARFGFLMLSGSLAYLYLTTWLIQVLDKTIVVLAMWLSCAVAAVGLAIAGPYLVARVFTGITRVARGGGFLVGLRSQATNPAGSTRLAALLSIIIVFLAGVLSFLSILNHGNAASWSALLARQPKVPLMVRDLTALLTLPQVAGSAPGSAVLYRQDDRLGDRILTFTFGTCPDLAALTGRAVSGCTGLPQWIEIAGRPAEPRPAGSIRLPDGSELALSSVTSVTVGPDFPDELRGSLLLPARNGSYQPSQVKEATFYLLVPSTALRETLARISGHSPQAQLDLVSLGRRDPDSYAFPGEVQWLIIGSGFALMIGVLALGAVIAAEPRERAGRLRGLRILGASRLQVSLAHFWSTGGPVLVLGWTATGTGWLVNHALCAVDPRAVLHGTALGGMALGVLAVAVVTAVATLPDALRSVTRSAGVQA